MQPWLTDWRGRFTGRALALASPGSTGEVAALAKLCAEHRIPMVPQGGNSGMSGGATPDGTGEAIVLSLRRMNVIRRLDPQAREITCEAGVILQTLHEAAAAEGLRFPLTLGGKGSATIGGLISTNAGGTQVLRHGSMRAQVLGLEAVLADGSVFERYPLKKDNRGFDLKQLLIGSEGTLGIVTAATLRLLPALAERAVLWAGLGAIEDARALLLHAERVAGDALEGFEVCRGTASRRCSRMCPGRARRCGRPRMARADRARGRSARTPRRCPNSRARCSKARSRPGWSRTRRSPPTRPKPSSSGCCATRSPRRSGAWPGDAARHLGPGGADGGVRRSRVAAGRAAFPGNRAVAFGHLGDGNVHFGHVLAPQGAVRGEWEDREGKAISQFVHDLVTEWNGSISAEHGIGAAQARRTGAARRPVQLALMRSVKQALDPLGLLNPGKLVPSGC